MTFRVALLAVLLSLPSWAAGSLEALRASSRGVRQQVSQLKAEQLERRNELSTLSSSIEALKAKAKGRLLPGGELDTALKRSQELSGVLTQLAQQVATQETELEAANLALLDGLSGELTRLRAEFDRQSDRAQRRALIDAMRRLRSEREALRATLPAAKLPTLDAVRPSDDPEELLEQADLLRDNEEKVQRELKALETRIAERRQEAELDRQVQRFLGEESMFDDQDRRIRLQRTTTTDGTTAVPTAQGGVAPADSQTPVAGTPTPPQETGAFAFDTRETAASGANSEQAPSVSITRAADARPQVGGPTAVAGGDEDLEDLEVQRVKLRSLAEELKRKAQDMERRASQLR